MIRKWYKSATKAPYPLIEKIIENSATFSSWRKPVDYILCIFHSTRNLFTTVFEASSTYSISCERMKIGYEKDFVLTIWVGGRNTRRMRRRCWQFDTFVMQACKPSSLCKNQNIELKIEISHDYATNRRILNFFSAIYTFFSLFEIIHTWEMSRCNSHSHISIRQARHRSVLSTFLSPSYTLLLHC